MGLGGGPREADEYEWVRLPDLVLPPETLTESLLGWLHRHPLWADGAGERVLLVDLDNLRADPPRWRARMAVMVALARQADHVVLAGQGGAVARARPHLAEFAARAKAVPDGSDLADYELLRGAATVRAARVQLVVVSNDGIFADLADRGPLVVVSPGRAALSSRLGDVATVVVDLTDLEEATGPASQTGPAGQTGSARAPSGAGAR